ncbi:hypothetical protein Tco_1434083, partial [Tanacetum coccineum]
ENNNGEPNALNDENHSASHFPCGSVSESIHHFVNVEEKKDKESPLVSTLSLICRNIKEGESSQSASVYIPRWAIRQRCRVDTPKPWFSVARGAMAQTNMLERFENLLDDCDMFVETHSECSETIRKLVDTRLDLDHNAKLYTNAVSRHHALKEEHMGCEQKVKALEEERNNLSVVNRDQALRIKELEAEVARKDSALAATKRTLTEGAKNVRTGWGKGVSEGHTNKEIMAVLHKAKNFNAYSDKKLYLMYDKLFEKEYPYIEKIASRYRHSVVDLLKVHMDPAPSEGTSAPTISKALGASCAPPLQKKT